MSRTVVLVGHCGPDMFMLKSAVGRVVPDATIEIANDHAALAPHVNAENVLLVNRVLDGDFDDASGIELIGRTAGTEDPPITILISNFPESQAEATAAGAPGFGKQDLYAEETAKILRDAVG